MRVSTLHIDGLLFVFVEISAIFSSKFQQNCDIYSPKSSIIFEIPKNRKIQKYLNLGTFEPSKIQKYLNLGTFELKINQKYLNLGKLEFFGVPKFLNLDTFGFLRVRKFLNLDTFGIFRFCSFSQSMKFLSLKHAFRMPFTCIPKAA
jgi:hypothetical protein